MTYKKKYSQKKSFSGHVKRHSDGFGFFIHDKTEFPDAYIPRHFMHGVMGGDRVEALISRRGKRFFCRSGGGFRTKNQGVDGSRLQKVSEGGFS